MGIDTATGTGQVAVYVDFDNIVMSRYDELHGRQTFRDDRAHSRNPAAVVRKRLAEARIDLDAILDFASSFGTVAISRAYADWSNALHSTYADQTMRRSIDLVQLFPMAGSKNGADIRLAIDVIDDLSRYPNISHVLVVAGDSDYVSLAQRCKRLGRRVIGIGAAKSVGRYWQYSCDEFRFYGNLPGVAVVTDEPDEALVESTLLAGERDAATLVEHAASLVALQSDGDRFTATALKSQIIRLDPSFDESALGFSNFSSFLRSLPQMFEVHETPSSGHLVRLLAQSGAAGSATAAPQRPDEAALVNPRLADLRHRLVSSHVALSSDAERACVRAIRATWSLVAPSADRHDWLPREEILTALAADGTDSVTAKWAAHTVMTSGLPLVLHDYEQALSANPELTSLTDDELVSVLRRWTADRARNLDGYQDITTEHLLLALYGDAAPAGAEEDLAAALRLSSVDTMRRALGPRLMPAPVLWDVSEAVAQLGPERVGLTAETFAESISPGLLALERAPGTIAMGAAFLSISDAGVCTSAAVVNDYADVAGAVLQLWAAQLVTQGHLVPHELTSMDAFYRLALPDRLLGQWRTRVRGLVPAA